MKKIFLAAALTGLLALAAAACGGSEPATAKPAEVQITLTEFKTESSLTSFEKGKTYRFNIENQGKLAHEWNVVPRGSTAHMEMPWVGWRPSWLVVPRGSTAHMEMLKAIGADQLPPGARVTVEYAFPSSIPGPLEFACHVAGHYEAGMHIDIEVK
jgi:uncharacterized cupredoxin-like copper-binding protein